MCSDKWVIDETDFARQTEQRVPIEQRPKDEVENDHAKVSAVAKQAVPVKSEKARFVRALILALSRFQQVAQHECQGEPKRVLLGKKRPEEQKQAPDVQSASSARPPVEQPTPEKQRRRQ